MSNRARLLTPALLTPELAPEVTGCEVNLFQENQGRDSFCHSFILSLSKRIGRFPPFIPTLSAFLHLSLPSFMYCLDHIVVSMQFVL